MTVIPGSVVENVPGPVVENVANSVVKNVLGWAAKPRMCMACGGGMLTSNTARWVAVHVIDGPSASWGLAFTNTYMLFVQFSRREIFSTNWCEGSNTPCNAVDYGIAWQLQVLTIIGFV